MSVHIHHNFWNGENKNQTFYLCIKGKNKNLQYDWQTEDTKSLQSILRHRVLALLSQ